MINNNQYFQIKSYITVNLSKKRRKHSIQVGLLAQKLCRKNNLNPEKGLISGIAHDIAREFKKKLILKYASYDNLPIHKWEKENYVLLHGRAGAMLLKEKFGVLDQDILDAVRYHTLGNPGLGNLSKIVYVADYLEPTRKYLTKAERENILERDIDSIVLYVTGEIIRILKGKGKNPLEPTMKMYEEIITHCINRP